SEYPFPEDLSSGDEASLDPVAPGLPYFSISVASTIEMGSSTVRVDTPDINSAPKNAEIPSPARGCFVTPSLLIYCGRYAVGVNVIICFYSFAQAVVETRRTVSPGLQTISYYCVTLFLDQASRASASFLNPAAQSQHLASRASRCRSRFSRVLADQGLVSLQVLVYLLMSASSAAASRHHLWVSRFGKDSFNHKINVAVWFSFLCVPRAVCQRAHLHSQSLQQDMNILFKGFG
ncbi:hypothetical protein EJB05_27936, partial [Eragrostis curvula]